MSIFFYTVNNYKKKTSDDFLAHVFGHQQLRLNQQWFEAWQVSTTVLGSGLAATSTLLQFHLRLGQPSKLWNNTLRSPDKTIGLRFAAALSNCSLCWLSKIHSCFCKRLILLGQKKPKGFQPVAYCEWTRAFDVRDLWDRNQCTVGQFIVHICMGGHSFKVSFYKINIMILT